MNRAKVGSSWLRRRSRAYSVRCSGSGPSVPNRPKKWTSSRSGWPSRPASNPASEAGVWVTEGSCARRSRSSAGRVLRPKRGRSGCSASSRRMSLVELERVRRRGQRGRRPAPARALRWRRRAVLGSRSGRASDIGRATATARWPSRIGQRITSPRSGLRIGGLGEGVDGRRIWRRTGPAPRRAGCRRLPPNAESSIVSVTCSPRPAQIGPAPGMRRTIGRGADRRAALRAGATRRVAFDGT